MFRSKLLLITCVSVLIGITNPTRAFSEETFVNFKKVDRVTGAVLSDEYLNSRYIVSYSIVSDSDVSDNPEFLKYKQEMEKSKSHRLVIATVSIGSGVETVIGYISIYPNTYSDTLPGKTPTNRF